MQMQNKKISATNYSSICLILEKKEIKRVILESRIWLLIIHLPRRGPFFSPFATKNRTIFFGDLKLSFLTVILAFLPAINI